MRSIVVAYDREGAIGKDNDLLWKSGEMKGDMSRFRELTMETTVIMGRKTLESIGRALPKRRNIVLTNQDSLDIPGVEIAHSLDEAYELAGAVDTHVIGGSTVYTQAMSSVDRLYATEVDARISGADSYFPYSLPEQWAETVREKHTQDDDNIYDYDFVTYDRI